MAHVRVVTDSGADIASDDATRLGITVIPLIVRFGQEVFVDGQLSKEEFWAKVSEGTHHPGTSQPPVGVFEEAFARLVEAGHSVLCLTITGKHSGTYSNAWSAARRFGDRVKVMDSLSLSLGQGFQALAAAQACLKGWTLDEVAGLVERTRERTHLFILLDTIEHLRRGGRADALIPALSRVAKVLRIKPILNVIDGRLGLEGMARSYRRGLAHIRREVVKLQPIQRLGVVHVRCQDAARDMAYSLAERLGFPLRDIVVLETGPALSTHGGPNVIGVAAVQQSA